MPRIRTLQPHFPKSRSMGRISRDARLLFIQLWLLADDAGRLRAGHETLLEELYPCDGDAAMLLTAWLDELEREKCIERYSVEGKAYLRVAKWRKHQTIQHPTPSSLPGAPHEVREVREESRRSQQRRASSDDVHESAKKSDGTTGKLSAEELIDELQGVLRDSRCDGEHTPALRAIELLGRDKGMWSRGRKEPETASQTRSPRLTDIVP